MFYLNQQSQSQSRFIRALYKSYTGIKLLQSTNKFLENEKINESASMFVFAGMLRGEGLIYRYCQTNKKPFLYVDHAYIERGYNLSLPHKEWMRVTPNAFTWAQNIPESGDRWEKYFEQKYPLRAWNSYGGKKILVLPPSEATKFLFPESVDWMNETLEKIAKVSNAEIRVREKPKQPTVDPVTNQVTGRLDITHTRTIEGDMASAKCIITFNSAVPVMGTILGIPCYCSPHAAAYPMNIDLNNIDNPPEPDRINWLKQLVYHQYRTPELIDGTFWNMITKYIS